MLRDFSNGTKFRRKIVRTQANSGNRSTMVQSPEPFERSEQSEKVPKGEEMKEGR